MHAIRDALRVRICEYRAQCSEGEPAGEPAEEPRTLAFTFRTVLHLSLLARFESRPPTMASPTTHRISERVERAGGLGRSPRCPIWCP